MAFTNNNGVVQIADDVLVAIVQTATMEIDGVHSIISTLASIPLVVIGVSPTGIK